VIKKIQQAAFASLLLFVSLYAQSVSVWTLDEQLSFNNLTVLRFRVQNTGQQTIRGLELHYRVKQNWSEIAPADGYYVPGGNMEWVQQSGGEAVLKISFPNAVLEPMEELSNSSGFSVGLHAKDWSLWNKQDHYSQPASNVFTLTDRISVYSNGILLNGEEAVSNADCPEVWFFEIQMDSVKIGWKPSGKEEQTILELRSFNGASQEVDLTKGAVFGDYREWSGAFPVQHENHGELWLNCSGKTAAYFAYGITPENAGPAVEAGLWDSKRGFVGAHAELGYNMGIMPGERFIVKSGEFGRRVADWKLYRPWEAPDLPELPTIVFPGLGVSIMPETPNDSMLFAWTAVEGFSLYQLYIVRDSAYGDTLHSLLVSGTEVRLPMPSPGVYVWWAEPVTRARVSLSDIGKAFVKVIKYADPITSSFISAFTDDGITPSDFVIPPIIKPPIGIIGIIFQEMEIEIGLQKTLGIEPIRARKDTRMLDLGWAAEGEQEREDAIDNGWWDSPDTYTTGSLREDVKGRCWAITVQQMNRYFGGTLTQDEIVYHGKSYGKPVEDHFPHGETVRASGFPEVIPTMGFALTPSKALSEFQKDMEKALWKEANTLEYLLSAPGWTMSPPLPYLVMVNIEAGFPMAVIQVNQGYDGAHVMIIDGYRILADGSIHLHFVGTDNKGASEWRHYASFSGLGADVLNNMIKQGIDNLASLITDYAWGADFYVAYYTPPAYAAGRLKDDLVESDSDDDGIVDFDEIYRFHTDHKNPDSDGDGINDKMEIAYYTRMDKAADIDRDGLRAELDVDSDGDGDCDGDENANGDGRHDKDKGETDMMDPTDFRQQRCSARSPVALLAAEQIKINDRTYCTDGLNYCPIVSMGLGSENAVQLGVSAKIGSILAGSSVWLRSNASVNGDVHAAGVLTLQGSTPQVFGAVRQNDAEAFLLAQIYRPLLSSFNMEDVAISGDMRISSGQTITLQSGSHMKNIVVSSGSVLRLQPGNYQVGNLTVQSGGKIELLEGGNIDLDIAGSFRWDGSFQGNSIQDAASRLRIRVLGSQDIFVNASFGGFIIAPNAYVVVGQSGKDHAGQIYAKRITIHQNVRFQWVLPGNHQYNITTLSQGETYVYFKK
jgi:hypothetical protein